VKKNIFYLVYGDWGLGVGGWGGWGGGADPQTQAPKTKTQKQPPKKKK